MATLREIKDRIQAVSNTKKITRTMEMISAAKAKKAIDRVHAAQPYAKKIKELISKVSSFNAEVFDPLLRKPESTKKVGILVLTANRGLCGGFNNNVIKMALNKIREYKKQGIETEVHLVGKKSVTVFNYQQAPYEKSYTHIDDKPKFEDITEIADYFMEKFESGEMDAVEIVYTKYYSASRQAADSQQVLPLTLEKEEGAEPAGGALFEPDPETIITELLPRAIRVIFYQTILESSAGEQIMRRIAMKNATDSASDMIKDMTRHYNRARQSKITQEISEIVAGADSVK